LPSEQSELLATLWRFRRVRFYIGSAWFLLRFVVSFRLTIRRPFIQLQINPRLQYDYVIIRTVMRALKELRKRKSESQLLVFTTLRDYVFMNETDIQTLSAEQATQLIRVTESLMAFVNIYWLETALSFSVIPLVELVDKLDDDVIAKFKEGEDNRTLLVNMRKISRKAQRRGYQATASAALGLLTVYLLTPVSQIGFFLVNAFLVGLSAFFGLLIFSTVAIWRSFPALLDEPDWEPSVRSTEW